MCKQKVWPTLVSDLHVLQEQRELRVQPRLSIEVWPGEGRQSSGGFLHNLKQRSPAWQSFLFPKFRLPLPSPASPPCPPLLTSEVVWVCFVAVGTVGSWCLLFCWRISFGEAGAGISCFPEVLTGPLLVESLSLHSHCLLCQHSGLIVTSCAQASLCWCPLIARATKHNHTGGINPISSTICSLVGLLLGFLKEQEINGWLGGCTPWSSPSLVFFVFYFGLFVSFPFHCLPLSFCCQSAVLTQRWLWSAADTVDLKGQMASQGSAHSCSMWPFHGLPTCLCCGWGWERVTLVSLFYINMSFCKYVTVWNYFVPVYIVWGLWIFLYQCKCFLYISARIISCFTHFLVDAEMFCMVSCSHNTGLDLILLWNSSWLLLGFIFCQLVQAVKILFPPTLLHCPGSSRLLPGPVPHWHTTTYNMPVVPYSSLWWLSVSVGQLVNGQVHQGLRGGGWDTSLEKKTRFSSSLEIVSLLHDL